MAGKKRKKNPFRRCLVWTFWLSLLFTLGFTWYYVERKVPDHLSVVVDEKEEFDFALPFQVTLLSDSEEVVLGNQSDIPSDEIRLKVDEPFSLYAKNLGSYHLGLKLFGKFQFKEIQLDVVDTHYAVPCGVPVGIYLRSNGVLVIGTGRIRCQSRLMASCSPATI